MVASLLRVVHSGPQNERLQWEDGEQSQPQQPQPQQPQPQPQPNVKFFMKIFRRLGRFTTQWVRLDFNTLPNFGQQGVVSLVRKGHLLSRLYLIANYPTTSTAPGASWTNSIGHALISSAELQIGGSRIERLDGQLLEILDEFNTPLEKVPVVNRLIGRADNNYSVFMGVSSNTTTITNLNTLKNTPFSYNVITSSNIIRIISNYNYATYNNTQYFNTRQDYNGYITSDNISITIPSDLSNVPVNLYYNFQLSVSSNFAPNPDTEYIEIGLYTPGNAAYTRYTFSNTLPPPLFNNSYLVTINNITLRPGQRLFQSIGGFYYSDISLSNQGLQIYFTYRTTQPPTLEYIYSYNITTYTSNYTYKNPLSNSLTTATPLPFFFSRNDASASLPVDAIQADDIRILINFRPLSSLYFITPNGTTTADGSVEGSGLQPLPQQQQLKLGDTYLFAEYIYLDAPEANRFRIADISLPITQHYPLPPTDTEGSAQVLIPIATPNPVRDIFFYCQPWLAPAYNAHFLATKYIGASNNSPQPWWPDASGLNALYPGSLKPGFWPDVYDSEPLTSIALMYEGRLTKFSTANPALFRSILPAMEQKKSPWVNRYYYNIPFGVQHGMTDRTKPTGTVNYDKITRRDLQLGFTKDADGNAPRYWVRMWGETYNILRIYGGRAGLLFGY